MKVSFDFDDTLSLGYIQSLAKILIEDEVEVWVVTARVPDEKAPSDNWNDDLWGVCKYLGIPKERVIFTSYSSKHEFFCDKDFVWHLDDDPEECRMINAMCDNTIAINHFEDLNWRDKL